jgi:hypothetical protein
MDVIRIEPEQLTTFNIYEGQTAMVIVKGFMNVLIRYNNEQHPIHNLAYGDILYYTSSIYDVPLVQSLTRTGALVVIIHS